MIVTSHTVDNDLSIAIELRGSELAMIVASTSSHQSWVSRLGNIIKKVKVDLAIRTTMGASWNEKG